MSQTYFRTEGAVVTISDVGRTRLDDEQRMDRATSIHTAIFAGSAIGLVVTVCTLVITRILGA